MLPEELRLARKQKGLTQEQLAKLIGLNKGDHLESTNPNYPDVQFDEYSKCIGKVLGTLKDEWLINEEYLQN